MTLPRRRLTLEELLLRHGAIDQPQLARAQAEVKQFGGDIGRALLDLGFVSEELLLKAQAHTLGIASVNPLELPSRPELTAMLPLQLAEQFGVVPVGGDPATGALTVATSSPGDAELFRQLARATNLKIEIAAAPGSVIEQAIRRAYYGEGEPPPAELLPEEPAAAAAPAAALEARLQRLERLLHPQLAALVARIERLEQIAETDRRALRALSEVLLQHGLMTAEDLKARLAR